MSECGKEGVVIYDCHDDDNDDKIVISGRQYLLIEAIINVQHLPKSTNLEAWSDTVVKVVGDEVRVHGGGSPTEIDNSFARWRATAGVGDSKVIGPYVMVRVK
jgi:hypothetical protein